MNDWFVIIGAVIALAAFVACGFAFLAWRAAAKGGAMIEDAKGSLQTAADSTAAAKSGLSELQGALAVMQQAFESLRADINKQMADNCDYINKQMESNREEMTKAHNVFRAELSGKFEKQQRDAEEQRREINTQMKESLTQAAQKAEALRDAVGKQMDGIRESNENKLEQMRKTVDEKLESTLQKRLGESFGAVSELLTKVNQDLGKMHGLAGNMTDTMNGLNRVLTVAPIRGRMGEELLENILRDILAPEQYDKNWRPDPHSAERVEFAIKIPKAHGEYTRLPVDSKFPIADYELYAKASEKGDDDGATKARKRVIANFESSAKNIQKYTESAASTDFAVMFVPTEGLYAVLANEHGFFSRLLKNHRIIVAGPHNFYLLLSTIKAGWQLFAINERSSEVRKVLSEVKSEFGKFGEVLQKVKTHLKHASQSIDDTDKRREKVRDKLRDVEETPANINTPPPALMRNNND